LWELELLLAKFEKIDMKKDLDKLAGWILTACIVVALVVVVIVALKYPAAKQTYQIELTIKTDSTGVLTSESQAMMDSVLHVVANQNSILQGKYEALADRESDNQGLMTIGGVLITIIVSILGFFGFRSFQSIEEKAMDNAEGAAKKKLDQEMAGEIDRVKRTVETEMVKKFDEEIKPKIKTEVDAAVDDKYNADLSSKIHFINDKEKEINSLREDVEKLKNKLSDAEDVGLNDTETSGENSQSDSNTDDIMNRIKERRTRKNESDKEKKGDVA